MMDFDLVKESTLLGLLAMESMSLSWNFQKSRVKKLKPHKLSALREEINEKTVPLFIQAFGS
jgi:hypothetical protein